MIEFFQENKALLLGGVGAAFVSGIFGIIIAVLSKSKSRSNSVAHSESLRHESGQAERKLADDDQIKISASGKMIPPGTRRKLVALLSIDVVGHSDLIWEDETGAYERVSDEMSTLANHVEQNHGRIVSLRGDSSLCEFPSAADAVRAAVGFQSRVQGSRRIVKFRIGVHMGDVIEGVGGDIYGASVNLAARLDNLADPGGICVSSAIYENVKGKLNVRFEPAGELALKATGEVIKTYRVSL